MVEGGWQQKRLPEEDVTSASLEGFMSRMDTLVLTEVL